MTYCGPHPELVGATYWLPRESFEHGWAPLVGCNQLRCGRCAQPVHAHLLGDGVHRRYACGCQQHDEHGQLRLGDDIDGVALGPRGWTCEGHPGLTLPAHLDGMALAEDGDWDAVARVGLAQPPFVPPGVEIAAPWITRLYRVLVSEAARARLSEAVAALIGDPDPELVAGALDALGQEPASAGAAQLAAVVTARRAWLGTTAHPIRPGATLLDAAAGALHQRLVIVDAHGRPLDRGALAVAEALALDGIGPGGTPASLVRGDPDWLWDHAGALVHAQPRWLGRLVQLSAELPPARRVQVLRAIASVGDEVRRALQGKLAEHVREPERTALLAAVEPARRGDGA